MKNLASIPHNIAIEGKKAGRGVGSGASSRVMRTHARHAHLPLHRAVRRRRRDEGRADSQV